METGYVMTAFSALAYTAAPTGNHTPPQSVWGQEPHHTFAIQHPVIQLTSLPQSVDPQLEELVHASMSRDFELKYEL